MSFEFASSKEGEFLAVFNILSLSPSLSLINRLVSRLIAGDIDCRFIYSGLLFSVSPARVRSRLKSVSEDLGAARSADRSICTFRKAKTGDNQRVVLEGIIVPRNFTVAFISTYNWCVAPSLSRYTHLSRIHPSEVARVSPPPSFHRRSEIVA